MFRLPMSSVGVLFLLTVSVFAQSQAKTDGGGIAESKDGANPASVIVLPDAPEVSQRSTEFLDAGDDPQNRLFLPFMRHIASDQKQFWTRPGSWTRNDATTLVPFAAFTGLVIGSDSWISKQVATGPNQIRLNRNISNYAVYSLVGAGGGAYLLGQMTKNDHLSETGLLSGEAALNSTAIAYFLKGVTQRPRPYEDGGSGSFWHGGTSFPSEHAAIAWSVASVLAHEYPGPLTKLFAYGLASAVTVTRVTGKQHFASDVLIGSALGWYMGRQVYRARHDPELGGAPWDDVHIGKDDSGHRPRMIASPYIPLDSWIYTAFERLAALGYIKSAYINQKPWTRLECARLVEEAGESIPGEAQGNPISKVYLELAEEFASESKRLEGARNSDVALDSVYTRVTGISGIPLRDSFHFGQTLVNDFGRPYSEGINLISGIAARATVGPFAFYARGEYQQAPSSPLYPSSALEAISIADNKPPFPNATAAISRIELLDSQVALSLGNLQVTFGKQSAWLGPTRSGSLLLSDNTAPITMLKFETVSPFRVPGLSRLLGPMKNEFFIGQLTGHTWINNGSSFYGPIINPQPFLHGDRISFKPTQNLQVGMGIAVMFGGPGLPFTWHNFLRTYFSHNADTATNPGKRFSAFDFSYRIPRLRKWVTAYLDSLVVDEVSPILSSRPSLNPGLYFPQTPKLHNLEFRVEGIKTQQAPHTEFAPGYVYSDRRYRNGYTNGGDLIVGNWIGRAGIGVQGWATYHVSPRNTVELSYRHVNVDHSFLEGGHMNDFGVSSNWMLHPGMVLSAAVQYEQWGFPLLAPTAQSNVATSIQFTVSPDTIVASRRLRLQSKVAVPQP
jgi:membrane-associated phospholipid phosphatase